MTWKIDAQGTGGRSVNGFHALQMLEPSLIELVRLCVNGGIEWQCLDEVIELIGFDA